MAGATHDNKRYAEVSLLYKTKVAYEKKSITYGVGSGGKNLPVDQRTEPWPATDPEGQLDRT
jgi:hypothetical protein